MDLDVKGKMAVVTGGANGIGFAAARLLAANGASVWIFDLPRENPENAAREIGARAFEADPRLRRAVVVGGALVDEIGLGGEHAEAVAEAGGDEELAVGLVVEDVALPLAEGG